MPVLDLHLSAIARRTHAEHLIYAAAPRASQAVRERLHRVPGLRLLDLPPTGLTGSREHSMLLDQLARQAAADGCEHLCTMDVDAFPVQDGWDQRMAADLAD